MDIAAQRGLIGWIVLIILVLVMAGGVLAFGASKNSLPGDLIYPAKQITDSVKIALTEGSYLDRATVQIDLSSDRLSEIEQLATSKKEDRYQLINANLDQMLDYQEKAIINMERAKSHGTDVINLTERLITNLTKQKDQLKELLTKLPDPVFNKINQALGLTQDRLENVINSSKR